jgi:hypothetical protein
VYWSVNLPGSAYREGAQMTDERPGKNQTPPDKATRPTPKEATPDVSKTDLAAVVDALTATNEKNFDF